MWSLSSTVLDARRTTGGSQIDYQDGTSTTPTLPQHLPVREGAQATRAKHVPGDKRLEIPTACQASGGHALNRP